jgi:hypothetical protein
MTKQHMMKHTLDENSPETSSCKCWLTALVLSAEPQILVLRSGVAFCPNFRRIPSLVPNAYERNTAFEIRFAQKSSQPQHLYPFNSYSIYA